MAKELKGHVLDLAKDKLGNFVLQSAFKYFNMKMKRELALELKGHIIEMAKDTKGIRILNTMINADS